MLNEGLSKLSSEITNAKASAGVAVGTSAIGVAGWVEILNPYISMFATIVGAILSIILMFYWVKESRRKDEKHALELEILRNNIESSKPVRVKEEEENDPE